MTRHTQHPSLGFAVTLIAALLMSSTCAVLQQLVQIREAMPVLPVIVGISAAWVLQVMSGIAMIMRSRWSAFVIALWLTAAGGTVVAVIAADLPFARVMDTALRVGIGPLIALVGPLVVRGAPAGHSVRADAAAALVVVGVVAILQLALGLHIAVVFMTSGPMGPAIAGGLVSFAYVAVAALLAAVALRAAKAVGASSAELAARRVRWYVIASVVPWVVLGLGGFVAQLARDGSRSDEPSAIVLLLGTVALAAPALVIARYVRRDLRDLAPPPPSRSSDAVAWSALWLAPPLAWHGTEFIAASGMFSSLGHGEWSGPEGWWLTAWGVARIAVAIICALAALATLARNRSARMLSFAAATSAAISFALVVFAIVTDRPYGISAQDSLLMFHLALPVTLAWMNRADGPASASS